ncbi:cupin domain-containing protein [Maricaulis sp. CAU 1757]
MRKFVVSEVEEVRGTAYPPPYDAPCRKRGARKLADAAGLSQFGANLVRLPPGVWTGQRHWHSHEDELVLVLEGEAVLVTDAGEEMVRTGEAVGFRAGEPDAHHFINRSERDCVLLAIGTRDDADACSYPDIDMHAHPGRYTGSDCFRRKDGSGLVASGGRDAQGG